MPLGSVVRAVSLVVAVSGCSPTPQCPLSLADSGCVSDPTCADAADGVPCGTVGTSCRVCVANTYHWYSASCERGRDGGAAWVVARGIPPPGCPPVSGQ